MMKIAVNEEVEFEFSPWSLTEATERINEIRHKHKERADDVLRGVLTILMFAEIEQKSPGTLQRLCNAGEQTAKALDGIKKEATK